MKPRCETLHAAAEIGEPVVAYSGLAARALDDDPIASIVLCQLWWYTAGGQRPTDVTAKTLHRVTGVVPGRQRRARETLRARGWLLEQPMGRRRVRYSINRDRVLADMQAARDAERARVECAKTATRVNENDHWEPPLVIENGDSVQAPVIENRSLKGNPVSENRSLRREPCRYVKGSDVCATPNVQREDQEQEPQPEADPVGSAVGQQVLVATGDSEHLKPEPKPAKRKRREPKVYRVELGAESPASARQAASGGFDALSWGADTPRIMEALTTARALLWRHPFGSYEPEDCQHVAAMLTAGVRVSEIVAALVGAYRKPYWRDRCPSMRDVRRHLAEFAAAGIDNTRPRKLDKGEAIEAWRAAYAALPLGARLDYPEAPDHQHQTAEQIALEASDMRKRAEVSTRKRLQAGTVSG